MKNVTITLDDEVARWAKIWAATHDTSVSRMLGEELRKKMLAEESYDLAKKRFMNRKLVAINEPASTYPKRDELHER